MRSTGIPKPPATKLNLPLLGLGLAIATADGYDTQSVAFITHDLMREWGASYESIGALISAGMLGGLCGAVIAPIVSRLGFRFGLIACILCFCVGSITSTQATSLNELIAYRLLTGVGLGAAIPLLSTLIAGSFPLHFRARALAVALCGLTLGGMLGNLIGAQLIPLWGWRSVFWLGGLAPLTLVPLCLRLIPDAKAAAERVQEIRPLAAYRSLFSRSLIARTARIWLGCMFGIMLLYSLLNWIPGIFQADGNSRSFALQMGALLNAGGVVASITFGYTIDKIGARRVMPIGFIVGAALLAIMGWAHLIAWAWVVIVFIAGFAITGAQSGFKFLVATAFPEELRVTAFSGALIMARIGAVAGPFLVGLTMDTRFGASGVFLLMAGVAVAAAACSLPGGQPKLSTATAA